MLYRKKYGAVAVGAHKAWKKSFNNIRLKLKNYRDATTLKEGSKLVAPLIYSGHFLIVVFSIHCSKTKGESRGNGSVMCYNSNALKTQVVYRGGADPSHDSKSKIMDFLSGFHTFICHFVLTGPLCNRLKYSWEMIFHPCLSQANEILDSCGLFAVGVVLHILHKIEITNKGTFDQTCITKLRQDLGCHLPGVENVENHPLWRGMIRECFHVLHEKK